MNCLEFSNTIIVSKAYLMTMVYSHRCEQFRFSIKIYPDIFSLFKGNEFNDYPCRIIKLIFLCREVFNQSSKCRTHSFQGEWRSYPSTSFVNKVRPLTFMSLRINQSASSGYVDIANFFVLRVLSFRNIIFAGRDIKIIVLFKV